MKNPDLTEVEKDKIRSVGQVSQKVLTANLREMETDALIERKVYAEVPPRVEYSLTALGQSLKLILDSLWAWGENYKEINKYLRVKR